MQALHRQRLVRDATSCLTRAYTAASGLPKSLQSLDKGHELLLSIVKKRVEERNALVSKITANPSDAVRLQKRLKDLEPIYEVWGLLQSTRKSIEDTVQLLDDEDPALQGLAADEYKELIASYDGILRREIPLLLISHESQTSTLSVLMEMKPGVGGAEASLFLEDLLRMYTRVAVLQSWPVKLLSRNDRDGGGIKSVILEVTGEGAYDLLRWESGVHRVQRVPSTESSGRVHTSTVQIVVLPLLNEEGQINSSEKLYRDSDVKIEVMRARGAGGQHVNKTESAVRLTHILSGITVSMQDERSQHTNKARAFKILQARLLERKLESEAIQRRDVRRHLVKSADRSEKIRTYNFAQDRVTDHRIGMTVKNVGLVLDGSNLQGLLEALSMYHQQALLENLHENKLDQ